MAGKRTWTLQILVVLFGPALMVVLTVACAHAATLSGRILDAQTGSAIPAATVRITNTDIAAAAGEDGTFVLTDVPAGRIEMVIRHVAYKPWRRTLIAGGLREEIRLEPLILRGQDIVVTASRAVRGETPVSFENMSRRQIDQAHYAQDVPMLLTEAPGVYAYSDNGNGIGYSYLSIRGFPQRRVSVLVNGVPLNDPESHEVYWIDLPDLPENLQDAQIQRGVGTTLYGSNSIGGTINLLTQYLSAPREVSATSGFGSYGTRKFSVAFNSGLIDDRHTIYGRFSRIVSDGYRQNSWTDLWSYFFAAARYDDKWTNRLNIFGGPEQTHLAYQGIPRWYIDGDTTYYDTAAGARIFTDHRPTGDPDIDRRFNPFTWSGETDNFNQPQYQFLSEFRPDSNWLIENTAYYIKGRGFYDQLRSGDFSEYHLHPFTPPGDTIPVKEADQLWRRRWVDNDFWGLVPKASYRHAHGTLTVGAEINRLTAAHWAEVQSVRPAPPDFTPGQRYYDFDGRKTVVSAFIQDIYNLAPKVTATGAVQFQFKRYELLNDEFPNYYGQRVQHTTDYRFLSPRLGVAVRPSSDVSLFASASYNEQEPTNDEVFDATDFYANAASFFRDTIRLAGGIIEGRKPIMKPERLINYELGASLSRERWRVEANLFHMRFHDEIVYNGRMTTEGVPIRANAPSSIHQGIEVSAKADIGHGFSMNGNLSINDNYFGKFVEYIPDYEHWTDILPVDTISRVGHAIAGFPKHLANVRLTYDHRYFDVSGHLFRAGRQYIDNSESPEASIKPYTVVNLQGEVKLKPLIGWAGVSAFIYVNNVLNEKYETGGYIDDHAPYYPLFLPAATTNFYAGLKAAF